MSERERLMEIRNECAVCLADCYKELFFGPSNRRCRAMTGAELRNRLSRLMMRVWKKL